jgi:hypothetical protein
MGKLTERETAEEYRSLYVRPGVYGRLLPLRLTILIHHLGVHQVYVKVMCK